MVTLSNEVPLDKSGKNLMKVSLSLILPSETNFPIIKEVNVFATE